MKMNMKTTEKQIRLENYNMAGTQKDKQMENIRKQKM